MRQSTEDMENQIMLLPDLLVGTGYEQAGNKFVSDAKSWNSKVKDSVEILENELAFVKQNGINDGSYDFGDHFEIIDSNLKYINWLTDVQTDFSKAGGEDIFSPFSGEMWDLMKQLMELLLKMKNPRRMRG